MDFKDILDIEKELELNKLKREYEQKNNQVITI